MVAVTENSNTNKIVIFSRCMWLKFCMEYKWELRVDWYQNKKKVKGFGQSDRLKIFVFQSSSYVDPSIQVHSNYYFLNHCIQKSLISFAARSGSKASEW